MEYSVSPRVQENKTQQLYLQIQIDLIYSLIEVYAD